MKEGSFRAVISTFEKIDSQGDLVLPGAFGRQETLLSQYNHGSWERGAAALPLGIAVVYEQGNEAIAEGEFDLADEAARRTYEKMKYLHSKGRRQEFSYALPEIDFEYRTIGADRVRVLKKIKVGEVSPVLMGASFNTRLLDIKQAQEAVPRRKLFSGPYLLGEDPAAEALWETREILAKFAGPPLSPLDLAELERIRREVEQHGQKVRDQALFHYKQLGADSIAPAIREAAGRALEVFRGWLGIPWDVEIRWFLPESQEDREYVEKYGTWGSRDWPGFAHEIKLHGLTMHAADHVWVRAGRDVGDTVETVAHELVHVRDIMGNLSEEEVQRKGWELMQAFFRALPQYLVR